LLRLPGEASGGRDAKSKGVGASSEQPEAIRTRDWAKTIKVPIESC
jgi:hypothetical protein